MVTVRADGRHPPLAPGTADRVLVDAPCTGLGALRRRPEARWRRREADVPELAALQRELLAAAVRLARPGAVVVYATCSPHPAETTAVVASVLGDGVEPLDVARWLPDLPDAVAHVPAGTAGVPAVQLWPHRHGTDAMFLAAVRRS